MSNSSEDVRATQGFTSNLDEVEIVFVEFHQAIYESFVKSESRKTRPKVIVRKRRKGRREVEKQASSKQRIRDGKEAHKGVKKDDIVNEIPARNPFLSIMNLAINKCTETDLKRRANDLAESIRERERGLKLSAQ